MAILIKTDGTITDIYDLSLEKMQAAVGGFIELSFSKDRKKIFIFDEEGKLKNKSINLAATNMARKLNAISNDVLVGDVIMANKTEID